MALGQVRTQVGANEPEAAKGIHAPGGEATKAAVGLPHQGDQPAAAPGLARAPWLVRNSRKATIALVLAILAASPFAYRYLQREFGPDPFAGIKLDGVKFDAVTGISEAVKPATVKPATVKPADAKPAAVPVAPSFGVTHTRPAVAAPVKAEAAPPVAAIPDTREKSARPRANARAEQTGSGPCGEAVAALGFCNPNGTAKGK